MSGGSKSQVTGRKWKLGMHMVFCHGPVDAVLRIRMGDRVGWTGNVTASQDIDIEQADLFGGDGNQGGIQGKVTLAFGESTQARNPYLQSWRGVAIPAYRGVLSFILQHILMAANNPSLRPWAAKVKHIHAGRPWYPEKAEIGSGMMNPAHIMYDVLTNAVYAMGYDASNIDDANFRATADELYSEGFGLAAIWNDQSSVDDFKKEIERHVDGSVYVDPKTGLFKFDLIRNNYDFNSLPIFSPSNILSVEQWARTQPGDLVNQQTVTYVQFSTADTDHDTTTINEEEIPGSITIQNVALQKMQGGWVSKTSDYKWITDDGVAAKVCQRDLRASSTPIARGQLIVNRDGWDLYVGKPIRIQWPRDGIGDTVVRVTDVDLGALDDGKIKISVVEDVFRYENAIYAAALPSGWKSPHSLPAAAVRRALLEVPYYLAVREVLGEMAAASVDVHSGMVMLQASKPSSDAENFDLWTGSASGAEAYSARGGFSPSALLAAAVPANQVTSVLLLASKQSFDQAELDDLILVDDEWMRITALDDTTATVDRGVLDTVPAGHAMGAVVMVFNGSQAYDQVERVQGETAYAKALTRTSLGLLRPELAPEDAVTLQGRFGRPYPPGKLQVNGVIFPKYLSGALTVGFAGRDRTAQTIDVVRQDAGTIGPETGSTATLRLYDETGGLKRTAAGLVGPTYAWATELADTNIADPLVPWYDTFSDRIFALDPSTRLFLNFGTPEQTGKVMTLTGSAAIDDGELVVAHDGGFNTMWTPSGPFITNAADLLTIEMDLTLDGYGVIIGNGEQYGNHSHNWVLGTNGYGGLTFNLGNSNTTYSVADAAYTDRAIPLHKRTRVVLVKTATTVQFFIDGAPNKLYPMPGNTIGGRTDTRLSIGCYYSNNDYQMSGRIGRLRIAIGKAAYAGDQRTRYSGHVRIELEAVRDGITSLQHHNFTVRRRGYGFGYGNHYGE